MSGRIIAFVNQKGGCTKTTSTLNIAYSLVKNFKKKVLCIDLDLQANLTEALGFNMEGDWYTAYDLITRRLNPDLKNLSYLDVVKDAFGIDLLPSSIKIARIDAQLAGVRTADYLLDDVIKEDYIREDYDFILIDTPPSLGIQVYNALIAADALYIPLEPDAFSVSGLKDLRFVYETEVQGRLNPKLRLGGVFFGKTNDRTIIYKEYRELLSGTFKDGTLLSSIVRIDERIKQAIFYGMPVGEYNPKSTGARDYVALTKEILEREAAHE